MSFPNNHQVSVKFQGNIGIINFGEGEKRFTYDFMKKYNSALDEIERNLSCKALVCTADGKFFSNGVDLKNLTDDDDRLQYVKIFQDLTCRILTFPMPTVAAINGHAFAGGAILALSHDYRVMRKGKGWISLNEVLINLRFSQCVMEIVREKVPIGASRNQSIIHGKRFTASEAMHLGIVDMVTDQSELVHESVQLVSRMVDQYKYDRDSMTNMKTDLYSNVLRASYLFIGAKL